MDNHGFELTERVAATERPPEKPIGFQQWTDLLFAHWRIPVSSIRDLIPEQISIDTFNGDAWIGLVPFYMSHVRPARFPAVPWISNFCETNLRTYVHLDGKRPGVWFFSLEASRLIPVLIARTKWHLNYHWAKMSLQKGDRRIHYQSRRISKKNPAMTNLISETGNTIHPLQSEAEKRSLEFFLAERYLLYTRLRDGKLLCGQVHHSPYPLQQASIIECQQTVSDASGINFGRIPDHVMYSAGVKVDVFPLRRI